MLSIPNGFVGPNYKLKFKGPNDVEVILSYRDAILGRGELVDNNNTVYATVGKTANGMFSLLQLPSNNKILVSGIIAFDEVYTLVEFIEDTTWSSTDITADVIKRFGPKGSFSTLKVKRALEAVGAFDAFKAAMTDSQWLDFCLAQSLAIDDPVFAAMLPGVKVLLSNFGVNDTGIIAMLTTCQALDRL